MGRHRLERMWERDPSCRFCGVTTYLPIRGHDNPPGGWPRMATEEHIIPRVLGGSALGDCNVLLACQKCNNEVLSLVDKWAARMDGLVIA